MRAGSAQCPNADFLREPVSRTVPAAAVHAARRGFSIVTAPKNSVFSGSPIALFKIICYNREKFDKRSVAKI